jgi:hypothetical protein
MVARSVVESKITLIGEVFPKINRKEKRTPKTKNTEQKDFGR